ncbi:hypothetical protein POVCU2_0020990 [Plasmodium ovale curtisi]|uniref:Uncharacterized protein n=1 Tax=Plasmodium ovale curtisi TaxID=864141 RepID=A0A1A8WF30_PLAOA|nr:hypothetical protein POVCU2_0020990 [Plasmodium ovale curtisi]SBS90662.1 hypothetical protein POVCU1_018850 [Plasmodium ovale curtisi]
MVAWTINKNTWVMGGKEGSSLKRKNGKSHKWKGVKCIKRKRKKKNKGCHISHGWKECSSLLRNAYLRPAKDEDAKMRDRKSLRAIQLSLFLPRSFVIKGKGRNGD